MHYPSQEIVKCKNCKIGFWAWKYKKRQFCSRSCGSKFHALNNPKMGYKKGSKINLGRHHTKEAKDKISKHSLGKKLSEQTKVKMSESRKGEKHHNWQGGITPINSTIRHSREYKLWREAVFTRDNWTCIWCGIRGTTLHADHIKQFAFYPELRFAIDNGRTLCVPCHKSTETYKKQKKT